MKQVTFLSIGVLTSMIIFSCSESDDNSQNINVNQTIAEITTKSVTEISFNRAKTGGIILNNGGGEITEKGVLLNQNELPTIENSLKIIVHTGENDFNVNLLNLEISTSYNVRAYAINEVGISYGNNLNFTTTELIVQGNGVNDIDNNHYPSLIYDGYEWTTKNLDVTKYRNGDVIPQVQNPNEWANLTTGAWCYYNNDPANGATYGKLYNWYAVNDPRGLAPEGWHVATGGDYYRLTNFLIDNDFNCYETNTNRIAKSIASTTLWSSTGVSPTTCSPLSGSLSGNNQSGFNGLPSGSRNSSGIFNGITGSTNWWTKGASSSNQYIDFTDLVGHIGEGFRLNGSALKSSGMSIRLVKD